MQLGQGGANGGELEPLDANCGQPKLLHLKKNNNNPRKTLLYT